MGSNYFFIENSLFLDQLEGSSEPPLHTGLMMNQYTKHAV